MATSLSEPRFRFSAERESVALGGSRCSLVKTSSFLQPNLRCAKIR
jgi:hypothetical protein